MGDVQAHKLSDDYCQVYLRDCMHFLQTVITQSYIIILPDTLDAKDATKHFYSNCKNIYFYITK